MPAPDAAPAPVATPVPTTLQVALKGLCPRCGAPTLFAGRLTFADRCAACGLDIGTFNVGDGPAAFLTLIWGAIIVGGAIALELAAAPPWWVQAVVWVPVSVVVVVASLRVSKAALLALEYRHRDGEDGR